MLTAIDINATKEIDIEGTIFVIKPLKNKQKMRLFGKINLVEGENVKASISAEDMLDYFVYGVKEIKNIIVNGKQTTIKEINEDVLDMFNQDIIQKIITEIINFNMVKEKDLKN